MLKLLITYCLTLLTLVVFGQSLDSFKVSGTAISLNSNKPIPFATIMTTRTKGYQSDSLGNFTVYSLSNGQHTLHFSAAGFSNKDTTILILGSDINNFKLTVYTDCSAFPHFNEATAQKDIAEGKPKLLLVGSIAPVYYVGQDKFEKKYKVYYYDFGCTPDYDECILAYNKKVFAYLDKKYGDKWRKEVRQDVIGFKDK
jgi:hypothetical protein